MMHAKQLLLLSSFAQGAVINSSQGGGGGRLEGWKRNVLFPSLRCPKSGQCYPVDKSLYPLDKYSIKNY